MNNIKIYIYEINEAFENGEFKNKTYNDYFIGLLRQIAVLRWGDDYDDDKLQNWINTLKNNTSPSFFVVAAKGKEPKRGPIVSEKNPIIGFAHFCQDKNNENQWYYDDLVIHAKYNRLGIFRRLVITRHLRTGRLIGYVQKQVAERIIENGMLAIKGKKA